MKAFHIDLHVTVTRSDLDANYNSFNAKVSRTIDVDDDTKLDEILDIPLRKLILGSAYTPKNEEEPNEDPKTDEVVSTSIQIGKVYREFIISVRDCINAFFKRLVKENDGYEMSIWSPLNLIKNMPCGEIHVTDNRQNSDATAQNFEVKLMFFENWGIPKPASLVIIFSRGSKESMVPVIELFPTGGKIQFPVCPGSCCTNLMTIDTWCELAYYLEKYLKHIGYHHSIDTGFGFNYIAEIIEKLRKADTKEQEE